MNIWSLEDNLEELVSSFHHMDSRDGTRVFRIDNQMSLPSEPSLWPSDIVFKDFFIFICLYHRILDLGPKFKSHHLWGVYRMYSNDRLRINFGCHFLLVFLIYFVETRSFCVAQDGLELTI